MNSRIILTKADFSANNIGRYVELETLTKKVLAKQTQYSVDSEEAIALNTFLTQITTEGFIGGDNPLLKTLFIPALANTHDELLYNIANIDENGYPVNSMSVEEISASQKAFALYESGGHKIALSRYAKEGDSKIDFGDARICVNTNWLSEDNAQYPSSTFIFYRLEGGVQSDNFIYGKATLHFDIRATGVKLQYGLSETKISTSVTQTIPGKPYIGFNAISYDKNIGFTGLCDNATFGSTELGDLTTHMDYATNYNLMCFGDYRYGYTTVLPFFAIGGAMTSEQMAALKGYIITLLAALHVINI